MRDSQCCESWIFNTGGRCDLFRNSAVATASNPNFVFGGCVKDSPRSSAVVSRIVSATPVSGSVCKHILRGEQMGKSLLPYINTTVLALTNGPFLRYPSSLPIYTEEDTSKPTRSMGIHSTAASRANKGTELLVACISYQRLSWSWVFHLAGKGGECSFGRLRHSIITSSFASGPYIL